MNSFGASPLHLEISQLISLNNSSSIDLAWKKLKKRFNHQDVGFYDSPIDLHISHRIESENLAQKILNQHLFTDCLFLGIGGSSLGPMSLLTALHEKISQKLKFHFLENPDPNDWKSTLSTLNVETTLVCVVTKSGTTFETLAQTLLALEWIEKKRWKTHLVILTDPEKGDLRKFAQAENIPSLSIHPSIGGRFSLFSPVGLFPAALCGLSGVEFLEGAGEIRKWIEDTPIKENFLFQLGAAFIQNFKKYPIHVCMPYSTRLKLFGSWFSQLWGESLGKDGKGFTPLAALGATDQHSILQLLRDGPSDKITHFLQIKTVNDAVKIPSLPNDLSKNYPAFKILENHTLHELLNIEHRAIVKVLDHQKRPHLTWHLEKLDERGLGCLYFAYSSLVSIVGALWNINPFDQPGVEEGKIYIRDALTHSFSKHT